MELEAIEGTCYSIKWLQDTLSLSIHCSSEEKINEIISTYFQTGNQLHLFIATYADTSVGVIGIEQLSATHAVIRHIAVDPDLQWKGIGRFMIENIERQFRLQVLSTEADDLAALFFEACGFQLERIEAFGPERYRCTKVLL
ncbi:MAG: GNAT family N-acetyltransferase [Bacteroidota bacterium]